MMLAVCWVVLLSFSSRLTVAAAPAAATVVRFGDPALVCENCSWPSRYDSLRQAHDDDDDATSSSQSAAVILGSAHGINQNLMSSDMARTWHPTNVEFPCVNSLQCVRAPDGRLHGFGKGPMPAFDSPDKPQSRFVFPSSWWERGSGPIQVKSEAQAISFEFSAGTAVQCANKSHWGGWPNQCPFWGASSGGHVKLLDGQTLLTVVVALLGGNEGATISNSGIYAFVSNDTLVWRQRSHIVTASQFPNSGEGASENSIARLANNSLIVIFRVDAGDGQLWISPPCPTSSPRYPGCLYKNYHRTISTDEGATWLAPREIPNAGAAFPRVLAIGGKLLLSGGRTVNRGRWDICLWVNHDGNGDEWEEHSVSALHNARIGGRVSRTIFVK